MQAFLLVHLPIMLLAASLGVWLFYVQHQFEQTSWNESTSWDLHDAALHGSSHYDLPPVLRWFTANIGIHHVHHLCSRIPYYRLPGVLRDHPELRQYQPPDLAGKPGLRAADVVGRRAPAAGVVPRGAHSGADPGLIRGGSATCLKERGKITGI